MSEYTDRADELQTAIMEIGDGHGELRREQARLESAKDGADSFRKQLEQSSEILGGIDWANREKEGALDKQSQELRERLQSTFNDLERFRIEAKKQREREDEAFDETEESLRISLGDDADRAAEEAERIVAEEFPNDNEGQDDGGDEEEKED